MSRQIVSLVFLLGIGGSTGCNSSTPPSPEQNQREPAGLLDKSEVETAVKAALKEIWVGDKVSEVTLTEEEPGKYGGTAKGSDGSNWKVKATQDKNGLKWEGESDRGQKASGSMSHTP